MALRHTLPDRTEAARHTRRLRRCQRWLQSAIVAPGEADEAIASPHCLKEFPLSEATQLIRSSENLHALRRLQIYRDMYKARLLSALEVDYPLLLQYLGPELFRELGELYITSYPSTSYTLNRLGDHLPAFIREIDGLQRPAFIRDLARYEFARTEVFDEQESPVADAAWLQGMAPENWAQLRLQPIAALRLLKLRYAIHEVVAQPDFPASAHTARPRQCYLAIYRRDYAVLSMKLSTPAFTLLRALMEGELLGEAIQQMFAAGGCREQDIFHYFQHWFSERLFAHVGVP